MPAKQPRFPCAYTASEMLDLFTQEEREALAVKFPNLDLPWEAFKWETHWQGEAMPRPKSRYLNWLTNAERYRLRDLEREKNGNKPAPLTERELDPKEYARYRRE